LKRHNATLTGFELRSKVTSDGQLVLGLEEVTLTAPGPEEVIVAMQAAPIHPTDVALLLGGADLSTMCAGGTAQRPSLSATVTASRMAAMKTRLDQSLPVGFEGAGTVVRAGEQARALLGSKVALFGGAMYARYRKIAAQECTLLPEGASAADGAAMIVNPLTALSMVENMRRENHRAMVHTAAASSLGQMLVKICSADGIELVNVVRSAAQVELLRSIGARHVVDSSSSRFLEELTDAIAATGATLAYDAIGGGHMASTLLRAMEDAVNRNSNTYHRYGSPTLKQVYIYGALDMAPTVIDRSIGMAWSIGGFLLMPFLQKIGKSAEATLRERIARELKTTFASRYTATISLAEVIKPEVIERFAKRATGEKFLVDPSR